MNQQELFDEFYKALEPIAAADGATLEKREVPKNNEAWQGIIIRLPGDSFAPMVYPNQYAKDVLQGISIKSLALNTYREAVSIMEEARRMYAHFLEPGYASDHLISAVIGYENNTHMLKDIPHERIADMAVYAKWAFDNGFSATVKAESLATLKMTKEEVLSIAKQNTARHAVFQTMTDIMGRMSHEAGIEEGLAEHTAAMPFSNPFYVLTTQNGLDGAALIADPGILKKVHETLGEDFYILPSSVHEVLILKESDSPGPAEELKEMVATINQEQLEPIERLSDTIYRFDGKKLSIAGTEGIEREEGIASVLSHRHSR